MRRVAVVLASVFVATLAALAALEPEKADAASTVKSCTGGNIRLSSAEKNMLELHNKRRAGPRLCVHPALQRAAEAHSRNMVQSDRFRHGNFSRRLKKFNYPCRACAENIGMESGGPSPKAMFGAWMRSSSHKRNILDRKFKEVGIGAATGSFRGAKKTLWTVDLGTRR